MIPSNFVAIEKVTKTSRCGASRPDKNKLCSISVSNVRDGGIVHSHSSVTQPVLEQEFAARPDRASPPLHGTFIGVQFQVSAELARKLHKAALCNWLPPLALRHRSSLSGSICGRKESRNATTIPSIRLSAPATSQLHALCRKPQASTFRSEILTQPAFPLGRLCSSNAGNLDGIECSAYDSISRGNTGRRISKYLLWPGTMTCSLKSLMYQLEFTCVSRQDSQVYLASSH